MIEIFDDLDRGWAWLVLVTCFFSNLIVGTTNYSVGLIHSTLLLRYQEGQGNTAIVGSLHTAIMCLAGPLSSFIIDKFSVRTAFVTSGIMYTVGYMGTAVAPTLKLTIFTCGIISGLGGAIGWTATMVAPGFYFDRYRNVAFGLVLSGTGVGIFILPPLIQTAADAFGSFGFFVCLSCITIHLVVFGVSMIPSKLEKHIHATRFNDKSASMLTTYLQVLKHKAVMCLSVSMFLNCFGSYIVFLHLPTFCVQMGASPMQSSYILSICGAASIAGRLFTGLILNIKRIDSVFVFGGSSVILGIVTILFPVFSMTYSGQIVYAICLGFTFGCPYVTATPINLTFLAVSDMAIAMGIELSIGGIGAIIGPIVAGFILDASNSYTFVFVLSGATLLLAGVVGIIPAFFKKPRLNPSTTELEVSYKPANTQDPVDTTADLSNSCSLAGNQFQT